jgi:ERCC4-type nuclease
MTADPQEMPDLPALRCLGDLASVRPVIVIDTREQTPLPLSRLAFERGNLLTGDYSVRGTEELFAIERKTLTDLVACCVGDNRDRFFRELHRLRGYRFKRLLVIGTRAQIEAGDYRSNVSPKSVLAALAAIEARFDLPVVFSPSPADAGREIERWAFWFARELIESVNTIARAHGLTRRAKADSKPTHRAKDASCRAGSINAATPAQSP